MDRRDRKTLKSYFRKGAVPTEGQFAELIDSIPNIAEDGVALCTEEGWAFHPKVGGKMQVTLHEAEGEPAAWTLALTADKGLAVKDEAGETLLELRQDKRIVLHADICQEGGEEPAPAPAPAPSDYREFEANKEWQDLAEVSGENEGSRVYTVIALYRDANLGVCKLTRATAICLDSMEQWVESHRKHWWGWSGCVRLRWADKQGKVCLQIRSTRSSYSGKIYCRVVETFKTK